MITEFIQPKFHIIGETKLEFDRLQVGEKQIKSVTIFNPGNEAIHLSCQGLNPLNGFQLTKALRPIPPKSKVPIKFTFKPTLSERYFSTVQLACESTSLTLKLTGQGVLSAVTTDLSDQKLNFGHVCIGDQVVKTFKIFNQGECDIQILLSLPHLQSNLFGTQNANGTNPFIVNPSRAKIEPNSFAEVTVKFNPDVFSEAFLDHLEIKIKGRKPLVVPLTGHGWPVSACISGYDIPPIQYQNLSASVDYREAFETGVRRCTGKGLNEAILDDEQTSLIYQSTNPRSIFYAVYSCQWTKEGSGWGISPKEVLLNHLKPFNLKLESKKTPQCEFKLETYEGSFFFDDFVQDYVLVPCQSYSPLKFVPDQQQGQIEQGSTKSIKFTALNSLEKFYENAAVAWEKTGTDKIPIDYQQNANRVAVSQPHKVENVFKLTLTNYLRTVEPRGLSGAQESITYYIKLIADPLQ